MNKWIKCMRIFFFCSIRRSNALLILTDNLALAILKSKDGIKLCIISLYIFVIRWTFCQIFINMPRALSVSLFSLAVAPVLSTNSLGRTPSVTAQLLPSQLDKVNTAITPNCSWGTCTINSADSEAWKCFACHCLPPQLGLFFFLPRQFSTNTMVDQITLLKSEFKSFFLPIPSPSLT